MTSDQRWMRRAITLAQRGSGRTSPNPLVGAVIVKDGRIIGEGWHRGPGQVHAEVAALESCRENPTGATIYVTLEPCNHQGRTPPCTAALIKAGIKTVQFAIADPNRRVAGGGAAKLRAAGITVGQGLEREAALALNRVYCHHCLTGRPWVILKAALSLDGKIATATGQSQWISGSAARHLVHQLRARTDAVLVGRGTQQQDDPRLTNRLAPPLTRQPLKVLLDSSLALAPASNLISSDPARLTVFCTRLAPPARETELCRLGARVVRQNFPGRVDLAAALTELGAQGVQSLLVEGGAEVFTAFWEADLINEFYLFYAPLLIGGSAAPGLLAGQGVAELTAAPRLQIQSIKRVGADLLIQAYREELTACLPV